MSKQELFRGKHHYNEFVTTNPSWQRSAVVITIWFDFFLKWKILFHRLKLVWVTVKALKQQNRNGSFQLLNCLLVLKDIKYIYLLALVIIIFLKSIRFAVITFFWCSQPKIIPTVISVQTHVNSVRSHILHGWLTEKWPLVAQIKPQERAPYTLSKIWERGYLGMALRI